MKSIILLHIRKLVRQLYLAFMFAFIFQSFFFQPFKIPSSSMKPGLQILDYLIVKKFSYCYNNSSFAFIMNNIQFFDQLILSKEPSRGDVIVFLLPTDRRVHYIKRLIGLPGEKIQIKKSVIYIDEIPVMRKVKDKNYNIQYDQDIYQEILPNGINYIIYIRNGEKDNNKNSDYDINNTMTYKVPKNHFFFMGDNRSNSVDSRFIDRVGYISKTHLIGKAKFLFWTTDFTLLNFFIKFNTGRLYRKVK